MEAMPFFFSNSRFFVQLVEYLMKVCFGSFKTFKAILVCESLLPHGLDAVLNIAFLIALVTVSDIYVKSIVNRHFYQVFIEFFLMSPDKFGYDISHVVINNLSKTPAYPFKIPYMGIHKDIFFGCHKEMPIDAFRQVRRTLP